MLIFMQAITLNLHYMIHSVLYVSKNEHKKELLPAHAFDPSTCDAEAGSLRPA